MIKINNHIQNIIMETHNKLTLAKLIFEVVTGK